MKTLLKANDSAHPFGWSAVARKAVPANGANQDYIYVSIYDASGACLIVGEAKTIEDAREYMKYWSFNDKEITVMKYTNEQGWKAVLDGDTWYIFDSRGAQVFYIHRDTETLDVLFVQMGFYK